MQPPRRRRSTYKAKVRLRVLTSLLLRMIWRLGQLERVWRKASTSSGDETLSNKSSDFFSTREKRLEQQHVNYLKGMSARREYRNAPVEEAIVEFRLAPGSEWDPTVPGKLHEHPDIKDAYSGRPRTQRVVQTLLQATAGQPAELSFEEGIGGVQLVDEDAKHLISVSPNLLSVHVLRPYEGWEHFRQRAKSVIAAYRQIVGIHKVQRLGLRYVNRIVIPTAEVDLDEYFHCGPRSLTGLPDQMASFLNRAEYLYGNGQKLIMTFATIQAPPGMGAFLLDLDVFWEGEAIEIDTALPILDAMHERLGAAFETVITDKMREVFDAGGP